MQMKTKMVVTLIIAFLISLPTISLDSQELRNVAEQYVTFLNQAGQSDTPITDEEILKFFSHDVQKIENGKTTLSSAKDLPPNWTSVRKAVGKWTVKLNQSIPSQEEQVCTIVISWTAEKVQDLHMTMAILRINPQRKITEIFEVWNKCNDTVAE